ncbi:glycosyltransferase family 2 protein [Chryseobacterium sp. A301]
MKILIVMPTHNEEQSLGFALESLRRQTYKEFKLVVVNDGSTDQSAQIAKDFSEKDSRFRLLNLPSSEHQPGAKVVRTFNKGLSTENLSEFDVVCKFDADIVFPENYLARLENVYKSSPQAGMVSGIVKIPRGPFEPKDAFEFPPESADWEFEAISSKDHVRGPIKSYRVACFKAMDGLRETLGWDNIDRMLAQKEGFEVLTLKDLWVKHLRPTAERYKNQKATKLGVYFYNIGLSLPLVLISAAKASRHQGGVVAFYLTLKSFLSQSGTKKLTSEEISYIRKLRWKEVFSKLKFKK